jgi:NADPH-dependent curcumin reductase CurA
VAEADRLEKIESPVAPIHAYLGALGMTGFTAWVGLLEIAALKPGERVFVSAASGAVGTIACQIAKARGCYVVGSVGSAEKARYLREELGVDDAIEYKSEVDLARAVAGRFPEGIDVYFDNVGGSHLQAALGNMRQFGRVAACGMIEQYNASEPVPGPNNLAVVVGRRLTIRGFLVFDHGSVKPLFQRDMTQWITAGQMRWRETIVDGLASAPAAFIGLFKGENIGKMLVRIGPDPHA